MTPQQKQTLYTQLIANVSHREPLQYFCETSSFLLNNPIMITDDSFYVLAHYQKEKPEDDVWNEIIERKYSPREFVQRTDIDEFWKQLNRSKKASFVREEASLGDKRRVVSPILDGERVCGYVTVLENQNEITEEVMMDIQMITDLLSLRFHEENVIADSLGQVKNEFTNNLLNGSMIDEEMIETRASYLNLKFYRYHTVIGLEATSFDHLSKTFDDFRHFISKWVRTCIFTKLDNLAYYIVSFDSIDIWNKENREKLEEYMKQEEVYCVFSDITHKLTDIPICYQQVRKLQKNKLYRRIPDDQHVYYYFLDQIYAIVDDMEENEVYDLLKPILEVDKEEGSELVKTLDAFFSCNQNVSAAATQLNIHRNTMNYRLSRIREILPVDFDDFRVRLLLQLWILKNNIQ